MLRLTTFLMAVAAMCSPAWAFSIATWNASAGTIEGIADREDNLRLLAAEYRKANGGLPDVLVLQEVTSYAAARKIADYLGYRNATIVTTDVGDDTEIWPFALEIAIVTTLEVATADTFQSLRIKSGVKQPPRRPFIEDQASGSLTKGDAAEIVIPDVITKDNKENPSRGILRVELANGTVIYGVHLKSSGLGVCRAWQTALDANGLQRLATDFGLAEHAAAVQAARDAVVEFQNKMPPEGVAATVNETIQSAKQREAGAAAVGELAKVDIAADKSVYVAGDFNTPLVEECKTGSDLAVDHVPEIGCKGGEVLKTCGTKDGFDDTFAILTDGLAGGPKFSMLTSGIGKTYVSTSFADSPIDNILVAGPASQTEHTVMKLEGPIVNNKVFGSDHYSVLAATP